MGLVEGQLHVMPPEVLRRAILCMLWGNALWSGVAAAYQPGAVGSVHPHWRTADLPSAPASPPAPARSPRLQPLSPLQEMPDSPEAAAAALQEEEQNQRGGVFSRLLSQLFDQSTWQQDPTWHHGTAGGCGAAGGG